VLSIHDLVRGVQDGLQGRAVIFNKIRLDPQMSVRGTTCRADFDTVIVQIPTFRPAHHKVLD
jgi:hypothetical protein